MSHVADIPYVHLDLQGNGNMVKQCRLLTLILLVFEYEILSKTIDGYPSNTARILLLPLIDKVMLART